MTILTSDELALNFKKLQKTKTLYILKKGSQQEDTTVINFHKP